MEKTTIMVFVLLVSAMITTGFFNFAEANPYFVGETITAPQDALPIVISSSSPKNNSIYKTNTIDLILNATSRGTSLNCITIFRYRADWLPDDVYIFQQDSVFPEFPTFLEHNKTYQVPDGKHSLTIYAGGMGEVIKQWTRYAFSMDTYEVVNFEVDTSSPAISILSFKNETYNSQDVPLNFMTNEPVSQISYVLDGQANVTINGNITLTSLSYGQHNVTMYAVDFAGNIGASETITLTVAIPDQLQATSVMAVSLIAVAVMVGSLLIYLRKRANQKDNTDSYLTQK